MVCHKLLKKKCVGSPSGLYLEEIARVAQENGWSRVAKEAKGNSERIKKRIGDYSEFE